MIALEIIGCRSRHQPGILPAGIQHADLRDVDARREDQRCARLNAMEPRDSPAIQQRLEIAFE